MRSLICVELEYPVDRKCVQTRGIICRVADSRKQAIALTPLQRSMSATATTHAAHLSYHVAGLLLVPKIGTLKLLGGDLRRLKIEVTENCNKPIAKRIGLRCLRR
jgi:hypothetical protein